MKPRDHEFWTKRLDFAHEVWKEHGMTGEGTDSHLRYIQAFRGEQIPDGGIGEVPEEDCVVVNVTFSNTRAMLSQLSARNPKAVVRAKGNNVDRAVGARINELVLQYWIDELAMKREIDKALRDGLVTRFGIILHGYCPRIEVFDNKGHRIETYDHARPDLPYVRRIPPWDVRIDPYAETFYPDEYAKWCAYRTLMTTDEIRRNPNMILRDDLRPTVSMTRQKVMRGGRGSQQGNDLAEMVEVWTIYDKVERKWFQISPGSKGSLREETDWPEWMEHLPYSFLGFNDQCDTPFPVPFPQVYAPQQHELNVLRTLMVQLVKRIRRWIVVNDAGLAQSDDRKLDASLNLVEVLRTNGVNPNEILAVVNSGTFPQELLMLDSLIKQDIREAIGLSQMDRGQRINVESATEAQGVLQGSAVQRGIDLERFEEFWSSVLRQFHKALQGTMTTDMAIAIVGDADARTLRDLEQSGTLAPAEYAGQQRWLQISPEAIRGEFKYSIRAQSTLPENHDRQLAKLLGVVQALSANSIQVDQTYLSRLLVEEAGYDSQKLILSGEEQMATVGAMRQMGMTEGNGKGGGGGRAPGMDANLLRQLRPSGGA